MPAAGHAVVDNQTCGDLTLTRTYVITSGTLGHISRNTLYSLLRHTDCKKINLGYCLVICKVYSYCIIGRVGDI